MNNDKMAMNIKIGDLDDIKCECGSPFFEQLFACKKIPVLQSPTGKEEIMPIPFFVCKSCGIPLENAVKAATKVI